MRITSGQPGHQETVTDLPGPTARLRRISTASLGLPAVVLSWTSVAVTLLVFTAVQATASARALFRLPLPASVFAGAAALLGALVVWICRGRPGRRFPRHWVLGLTGGCVLLALYGAVEGAPGSPWSHAAALAGLAGALVLTPRLITVPPERRWLEAVVPAGLVGALLVLAPILAFARWSFLHQVELLDRAISGCRTWAEVTAPEGTDGADPQALEQRIAGLDAVAPEDARSTARMWRTARVLGREAELAEALSALAGALVTGLDPAGSPRLSAIDEPAVRWDPEAGKWVESAEFVRWSGLVATWYRRLGRTFAALDPGYVEGSSAALAGYREDYRRERGRLRDRLEASLDRWTDHWPVPLVPGAADLVTRLEPSLSQVLQAPLAADPPGGPAPADLDRLLEMRPEEIRTLAATAPGCRLRRYAEDGRRFERVDCPTYSAASNGIPGAALRIEVRLVLVGSEGEGLQRPAEVYFLFPVPGERDAGEYLEEVARAIVEAVDARSDRGMRLLDRSGSALHGFVLGEAPRQVVVYRPRLILFLDGRRAVEVRAERRRG